jgi:hypothetical protein
VNRQRFVTRDPAEEGEIRSQQLGAALAQQCDPEFLEAVLHMKSALDEFGGQAYIAASRDRFGDDGRPDESGRFYTWGYIVHYGSKVTIRRLQTDEEVPEEGPPPEADEEAPVDGAETLEPVEA